MRYSLILMCVLFLGCMTAEPNPYINSFDIEWDVPEGTLYYKAFTSIDSIQIKTRPFSCRRIRIPPPMKEEEKQQYNIRHWIKDRPYDIYVRVFAFDIDGNYKNVKLLNLEGS